MKGVLLVLIAVVSAATLTAPSSAGPARTIRLAWSERATEGSRTVMTYNVRTLTLAANTWSVDASFRNTSRKTLRLRPDFALLYGSSSANVKAMKRLNARTFRPALPAILRPGKGWSGRMSGVGARSLKNTNVRVHFGYFAGRVLAERAGFSWITDHVLRLS
jgi:hypothetical protein